MITRRNMLLSSAAALAVVSTGLPAAASAMAPALPLCDASTGYGHDALWQVLDGDVCYEGVHTIELTRFQLDEAEFVLMALSTQLHRYLPDSPERRLAHQRATLLANLHDSGRLTVVPTTDHWPQNGRLWS